MNNNRRDFLKKTALCGVVSVTGLAVEQAIINPENIIKVNDNTRPFLGTKIREAMNIITELIQDLRRKTENKDTKINWEAEDDDWFDILPDDLQAIAFGALFIQTMMNQEYDAHGFQVFSTDWLTEKFEDSVYFIETTVEQEEAFRWAFKVADITGDNPASLHYHNDDPEVLALLEKAESDGRKLREHMLAKGNDLWNF